MATTEPLTGITVYDQTDPAQGGLEIGNVVKWVAPFCIPRYASAAARDSASASFTSAGGTLAEGQYCDLASDNRLYRYDAGAWGWPKWAQGVIAYAQYSNSTGLVLSNAFANLGAFTIPAVTIPANRRIRLSFHCITSTDVAGTLYLFSLAMNQGSGGQVRNYTLDQRVASTEYPVNMWVTATPAAGTWQFQVGGQRVAGTGTTTLNATPAAEGPAEFLIEDLGAAA